MTSSLTDVASRCHASDIVWSSGCPAADTYLLQWTERKVQITLIVRGFTRAELLRLAVGMRARV